MAFGSLTFLRPFAGRFRSAEFRSFFTADSTCPQCIPANIQIATIFAFCSAPRRQSRLLSHRWLLLSRDESSICALQQTLQN
jgi:hypothetical protein